MRIITTLLKGRYENYNDPLERCYKNYNNNPSERCFENYYDPSEILFRVYNDHNNCFYFYNGF